MHQRGIRMYWLTIDTSGADCQTGVVACKNESVELVSALTVNRKNVHSEKLITFIEWVLRQANIEKKDLCGIALTIGPGSFTGLRVGLSTAKGLAFALRIPVIAVPTLDVIAAPFHFMQRPVLTAIQSRKGEFYTAGYENGALMVGPEVTAASVLIEKLSHPLIFVCDSINFIHHDMPPGSRSVLTIPERHHAKPDLYYLGLLGYRKFINNEMEDIDTMVPLYIQPFLGKKP